MSSLKKRAIPSPKSATVDKLIDDAITLLFKRWLIANSTWRAFGGDATGRSDDEFINSIEQEELARWQELLLAIGKRLAVPQARRRGGYHSAARRREPARALLAEIEEILAAEPDLTQGAAIRRVLRRDEMYRCSTPEEQERMVANVRSRLSRARAQTLSDAPADEPIEVALRALFQWADSPTLEPWERSEATALLSSDRFRYQLKQLRADALQLDPDRGATYYRELHGKDQLPLQDF